MPLAFRAVLTRPERKGGDPVLVLATVRGAGIAYLMVLSPLPSSTQGKDNRRVQMTKVVLLYRSNLPCTVKPDPWCIWI